MIQLWQLAIYLPYGLKGIDDEGNLYVLKGIQIKEFKDTVLDCIWQDADGKDHKLAITDIKPLLNPVPEGLQLESEPGSYPMETILGYGVFHLDVFDLLTKNLAENAEVYL
ncbi:MAG TPA: hypothetical protein VK031_06655 [Tissierellaceae bacterium]|nr:hypothetical protein [Tissierellaceae bacterium]